MTASAITKFYREALLPVYINGNYDFKCLLRVLIYFERKAVEDEIEKNGKPMYDENHYC